MSDNVDRTETKLTIFGLACLGALTAGGLTCARDGCKHDEAEARRSHELQTACIKAGADLIDGNCIQRKP